MTASRMMGLRVSAKKHFASLLRKRPALRRQLLQERRWLEVVAKLAMKLFELGQNCLQSDRICVEHWAATIDRPSVTVDPDDVDVGGALRLPLLKDFRAFVDHRIDAALQDFGIADLALLDSLRLGEVADDPLDLGRGLSVARFVVIIETRAGFLAAPAFLAQDFADRRALRRRGRPADVEAGEGAPRAGTHRQAEVDKHTIDVRRRRSFENEFLRLTLALGQHAVADEAMSDADDDGDLADLRRELSDACQHGL